MSKLDPLKPFAVRVRDKAGQYTQWIVAAKSDTDAKDFVRQQLRLRRKFIDVFDLTNPAQLAQIQGVFKLPEIPSTAEGPFFIPYTLVS